jgi:hypothetical protein
VIPRSMEAALNQDSLEATILQKPVYHLKLDIQGLQQASWQKVDLSFHSAIWPFLLTTQSVCTMSDYLMMQQESLHTLLTCSRRMNAKQVLKPVSGSEQ